MTNLVSTIAKAEDKSKVTTKSLIIFSPSQEKNSDKEPTLSLLYSILCEAQSDTTEMIVTNINFFTIHNLSIFIP